VELTKERWFGLALAGVAVSRRRHAMRRKCIVYTGRWPADLRFEGAAHAGVNLGCCSGSAIATHPI